MPTMQGKPIHSKGSKVVVGRRFMSPTVSQVLAVKGCSWMMSLHCSWGSGDRKKMKETAWECRILLMEEIRLASWYVVYPIIHKVLAPSHSSQYLKDARGTPQTLQSHTQTIQTSKFKKLIMTMTATFCSLAPQKNHHPQQLGFATPICTRQVGKVCPPVLLMSIQWNALVKQTVRHLVHRG